MLKLRPHIAQHAKPDLLTLLRSVNTIADIWRGEPYPRHLHLLDNDFFGQTRDQWEARVGEIRDGGFKVCLNQGINIRMIDADAANESTIEPSRELFEDLSKRPSTRDYLSGRENIRDHLGQS